MHKLTREYYDKYTKRGMENAESGVVGKIRK